MVFDVSCFADVITHVEAKHRKYFCLQLLFFRQILNINQRKENMSVEITLRLIKITFNR